MWSKAALRIGYAAEAAPCAEVLLVRCAGSTGEAGLAWGAVGVLQGWDFSSPGITRHFGVLARPLGCSWSGHCWYILCLGSRALPGGAGVALWFVQPVVAVALGGALSVLS